MSKRRERRLIAEFGMSFLDVISCGFGAIILLLIITKTTAPTRLEDSQLNLEGQIAQREEALYEIRGRITELRRQVTDAESQLDDNLLQVAALEKELTDILGRYSTTVDRQDEALEDMKRLLVFRGFAGQDFICVNCSTPYHAWQARCDHCHQWNKIILEAALVKPEEVSTSPLYY